jgi:hypothetical protein
MAVGNNRDACRRPAWQRPDLARHVSDLELASLDVMIEMGPFMFRPCARTRKLCLRKAKSEI